MLRFYLFLFLFVSIGISSYAQPLLNNFGKDFYVAFSRNNNGATIAIQIAASENTIVTISSYLGEETYLVQKDTPTTITFQVSFLAQLEQVENKGIHIRSTKDITVIASSLRDASSDAAILLPTPALGNVYTVNRYHFVHNSAQFSIGNKTNRILVLATEDQTLVHFKSVKTGQIIHSVMLNRLQTYLFDYALTLSAVRVELSDNNKKVAVFYANDCVYVGNCVACDHIFTQVIPDINLGTSYVALPIVGQTNGYILSVLAIDSGTTIVQLGSEAPRSLEMGDYVEFNINTQMPAEISSTNKVSVFQFLKGQRCHTSDKGDPACTQLNAIEQFTTESKFVTLNNRLLEDHYISILVRKNAKHLLYVNGGQVNPVFFSAVEPFGSYAIYEAKVPEGIYHITSSDGFVGYVYGLGRAESYFTTLGAAYRAIEPKELVLLSENVCQFDTVKVKFTDHQALDSFGIIGDWTFLNDSVAFHIPQSAGSMVVDYFYRDTMVDHIQQRVFTFLVNPAPFASFPDVEICEKQFSHFKVTADSLVSAYWINPFYDTLYDFEIKTNIQGAYAVYQENIYGCSILDSFKLNVLEWPRVSFFHDSVICLDKFLQVQVEHQNDSHQIIAVFLEGFEDTFYANNPSAYWLLKDTGLVNLQFISSNNNVCYDTFISTVNVLPTPYLNIHISGNAVCFNSQKIEIFAEIDDIWGVNPDCFLVFESDTYFVFDSLRFKTGILLPGTYPVSLIASTAMGCIIFLTDTIVVLQNTVFDFELSPVCLGETVQFNAQGLDSAQVESFRWNFGDGTIAEGVSVSHMYADTGSYAVTAFVVNKAGCKDTIVKPLAQEVWSRPIADFIFEPLRDSASFILYKFSDLSVLSSKSQWVVNQQFVSSQPVFIYPFQSTGLYTVELIAENEIGCKDSAVKLLDIKPLYHIFIPNVFSPNNNGLNEVFQPVGIDAAFYYQLRIFDRWGGLLFISNDLDKGWDGTADNIQVPVGVYVYIVELVDLHGNATEYKGTVQLLR